MTDSRPAAVGPLALSQLAFSSSSESGLCDCGPLLFMPPPSVGGIGSRQQKQRLRALFPALRTARVSSALKICAPPPSIVYRLAER